MSFREFPEYGITNNYSYLFYFSQYGRWLRAKFTLKGYKKQQEANKEVSGRKNSIKVSIFFHPKLTRGQRLKLSVY